MKARIEIGEHHGNAQEGEKQGLRLKEPEEEKALVTGHPAPEFPVAAVFLGMMSHDPLPEMHSETEAPEHRHQRDEILSGRFSVAEHPVEKRKRSKAQGPGDVDDAGIADAHGDHPDHRHEEA